MAAHAVISRVLGFFQQELFANLHPVFWPFVPYWTIILIALAVSPLTILLPQFLKGELEWQSKDEIEDVWFVHGRRYNLKPFYKTHPGGEHVFKASKGTDITGLFESYHVFIDREVLLKMLARFEIKEEGKPHEPLVVPADPFHEDLKQVVRDHFKGQPKGAHKMTRPHLALCFLCWVTMLALCHHSLSTDTKWTIPIIGFCVWYLIGNVMHDASHYALVTTPWINRVLAHAAFPFGINVTAWHIEHVACHHIYTNDDQDVDLYHFEPVVILKEGVGTVPAVLHYIRLAYILSTAVLHLAIAVPYGLIFGQVDPAHGHRMYDRFKDMEAYRAQLRGSIMLELIVLFGGYCVMASYQGFVQGLCFYLSVGVVSSYLFSFFTQVSHLQAECFPETKESGGQPFMKRQVASSMDFAADSAFWGHISGGLNTQAIHHCVPSVSAMHLRALYPKFRQTCRKHGVELKEAKSLSSFICGFVQLAN